MGLKPTNVKVELQTGTDRTLFATWKWNKSNTDKYDVSWKYDTGDGVWFTGSDGTSNTKDNTYSAPSNAIRVAFKVRAVSKTKGKKGVYWKCGWSTTVYYDLATINLTDPGAPSVSLIGNKLTATINEYTATDATGIEFQLVKNDSVVVDTKIAALRTTHSSFLWTVETGNSYKVRARGVREKNEKVKASSSKTTTTKKVIRRGPWSTYSESVKTGFEQVKQITSIETYSAYGESGGVKVSWTAVKYFDPSEDSDDKYTVEYTDDPELFDSGETNKKENLKSTHTEITGLTLGHTYYFRVRAETGNTFGAWSPIASSAVGTQPSPPTTWSLVDTISLGEDIVLNWVHSSDDGSTQTSAKLSITIGEDAAELEIPGDGMTLTIRTDTEDHWKEVFGDIIPYPTTDAVMIWNVSTKGIVEDYSDPSADRTVNMYEPVMLDCQLYSTSNWLWDPFRFETDTVLTAEGSFSDPIDDVTSYPIRIGLVATPDSQKAITYSIIVTANEAYDRDDTTGGRVHISKGDEVFNGLFPASRFHTNSLWVTLYPADIDLENNISYTITASVAMDSGLTGEASMEFDVALDDEEYELEAEITFNEADYSTAIRPICRDEFGNVVDDVYLSVYRREYNGKFTPIETYINAEDDLTVPDPHPSLDYARYRLVAISKKTGAITYEDIPGYEIGINSIVIQWDETRTSFDVDDTEELVDQPTEGSVLVLPYNVEISATHSNDVSLVEYIGRDSPTSYYGTQDGEIGTWNCDIPKSDKETLYAIRRLGRYKGDAYVREPSGIGYWAQLGISYSISHESAIVPVTFNVTRVTGGV